MQKPILERKVEIRYAKWTTLEFDIKEGKFVVHGEGNIYIDDEELEYSMITYTYIPKYNPSSDYPLIYFKLEKELEQEILAQYKPDPSEIRKPRPIPQKQVSNLEGIIYGILGSGGLIKTPTHEEIYKIIQCKKHGNIIIDKKLY